MYLNFFVPTTVWVLMARPKNNDRPRGTIFSRLFRKLRTKTTVDRVAAKRKAALIEELEKEAYALISAAILSIPGGHYDFYSLEGRAFDRLYLRARKWLRERIGPPDPRIKNLGPLFHRLSPFLFRLSKRGIKKVFTDRVRREFLYHIEHHYERAKRQNKEEAMERLAGGLLSLHSDMRVKKNLFLITFLYFQLLRAIEREYEVTFDIPEP